MNFKPPNFVLTDLTERTVLLPGEFGGSDN